MPAMRLVAALTALLLAASGVAACPQSPLVAKVCCKVRCHHEATGSIARCCCGTDRAPSAKATSPQAKPALPASGPTPAIALPQAPAVPVALAALGSHAPPGGPLFLQRCTLIL